jgi:ankyrin repeat protein
MKRKTHPSNEESENKHQKMQDTVYGMLVNAVDKDDCKALDTFLREDSVTMGQLGKLLLFAAFRGHVDCFRILMRHGAPALRMPDGKSLLNIAMNQKKDAIIKCILHEHPQFTILKNEGEALFIHCAYFGLCDEIRILIARGFSCNTRSKLGCTALRCAAYQNQDQIVAILLEQPGIEIDAANAENRTALHVASARGYTNIAKQLLEKKCNVNLKDIHGLTALHYACQENHIEIARLLLKAGADTNAETNQHMTPLFTAIQRGAEDIVVLLIEEGHVDINYRDTIGMNALRFAAVTNREAIFCLLVDRGGDPLICDRGGYNTLHTIANFGRDAMLRYLLQKMPRNIHIDTIHKTSSFERTPLCIAVCRGQLQVVRELTAACPQLKNMVRQTRIGSTSVSASWLHWSRMTNHQPVVEYFASLGINSCHSQCQKGCAICKLAFCMECRRGEQRCFGRGCTYRVCHACVQKNPMQKTISNCWDRVEIRTYCKTCMRSVYALKWFVSCLSKRRHDARLSDCSVLTQ